MFKEPTPVPFTIGGGLDQISSNLDLHPGKLISCDGVELVANDAGLHRKGGYERCAGDTLPSDTSVIYVTLTAVVGTITSGDSFTSGATGVTIKPLASLATPAEDDVLACAKISGTVTAGDVFSDGTNQFSVKSLTQGTSTYTDTQRKTYNRAAVEQTRTNISAVTGSGSILGGFRLGGYVYAFRNATDGLSASLYKGGGYTWTEVDMPDIMLFDDGIVEFEVGDVVTDGTAVGTVASYTRQSGAWDYEDSTKSAGYLTLSNVTGTFTDNADIVVQTTTNDLVTNGAFAADTDWTKGTGWTIGSGVATKAAGTGSNLEQDISAVASTAYVVVFTITRTAGTIQPMIGTVTGTAVSVNGTYREVITGDDTTLYFVADAAFAGTIDNVSVIAQSYVGFGSDIDTLTNGDFAADRAWTKGTGWAIGSGTATKTAGSASTLTHPFIHLSGRSIKITFTVSGYSAGTLTAMLGDDEAVTAVSADGTYSHYITASADTTTIGFSADATFAGSIDNVTVTDGGFAKVAAENYTYSLNPGGRYSCIEHNFTNIEDNDHVFGVSGANDAFEFDGTNYIPIFHPDTAGFPTHVLIHQERLMLVFPGGEWPYSVVLQPRVFNSLLGAGSHSAGAEIVGTHTVNGNAAVAFCEGSYWMLIGDGVYDEGTATRNWTFYEHDENIGAEEWSVAGSGEFFFLDHSEIRSLNTTASYGGFYTKPIAEEIRPFLESHSGTAVAALYVKEKGQYRIFFSDGKAAYITFSGGKLKGPTTVSFPDIPTAVWSAHEGGEEYLYFGDSSGYVHRMDSGNTCDDGYIEGSFRLPFYHYGTPRNEKRIPQVIIEFDAPVLLTEDTTMTYTVNFSHGRPDVPKPVAQTITEIENAGGIYGSNAGYGSFAYSGAVTSEIVAYLDGWGANMSLMVSFRTKYDSSFAFLSVIADVLTFGLERR